MNRIASLLPSATEIVYALGLGDRVVGVSHSCDYPREVRGKPVFTRPRFAPEGLASGEIDAAVRDALRRFGSVYEVDAEGLAAAQPDLVLTQGVCEVCAVPTRDAEAVALRIASRPTVLTLDAHDVAGVLETIREVGRAGGVPARAEACVRDIERRIAAVGACVAGRAAPRVLALEWLEPPFVPGHWVPEQVRRALDVGRAAAAQGQHHTHVAPADAVLLLAVAIVGPVHERPQAHEVDGEQEVVQIEVAALRAPLHGDELAVARTGLRCRSVGARRLPLPGGSAAE